MAKPAHKPALPAPAPQDPTKKKEPILIAGALHVLCPRQVWEGKGCKYVAGQKTTALRCLNLVFQINGQCAQQNRRLLPIKTKKSLIPTATQAIAKEW